MKSAKKRRFGRIEAKRTIVLGIITMSFIMTALTISASAFYNSPFVKTSSRYATYTNRETGAERYSFYGIGTKDGVSRLEVAGDRRNYGMHDWIGDSALRWIELDQTYKNRIEWMYPKDVVKNLHYMEEFSWKPAPTTAAKIGVYNCYKTYGPQAELPNTLEDSTRLRRFVAFLFGTRIPDHPVGADHIMPSYEIKYEGPKLEEKFRRTITMSKLPSIVGHSSSDGEEYILADDMAWDGDLASEYMIHLETYEGLGYVAWRQAVTNAVSDPVKSFVAYEKFAAYMGCVAHMIGDLGNPLHLYSYGSVGEAKPKHDILDVMISDVMIAGLSEDKKSLYFTDAGEPNWANFQPKDDRNPVPISPWQAALTCRNKNFELYPENCQGAYNATYFQKHGTIRPDHIQSPVFSHGSYEKVTQANWTDNFVPYFEKLVSNAVYYTACALLMMGRGAKDEDTLALLENLLPHVEKRPVRSAVRNGIREIQRTTGQAKTRNVILSNLAKTQSLMAYVQMAPMIAMAWIVLIPSLKKAITEPNADVVTQYQTVKVPR